jgi:two-component system, NarL family, nitrate/nitrite response regulator NarL
MEPLAMVGRAEELGELSRAWKQVRHDQIGPRAAVITGPAGIGKSRLVSTALPAGGEDVHFGAARLHSPAPYDWLAAVLSRRNPAIDERLEIAVPADALAWLRQDVDVPRERYAPDALLRIAVRVVRALVGARPGVLVVEDLHALDPASLNLIAALATTPMPALLLVTSRGGPGDVPPLVADVLARLAGTPNAIRQHLAPLDAAAVQEVLATAYPDADATVADAVLQRTGGNPFRLTELLAVTRSLDAFRAENSAAEDLTARERDVLACIADGMSNQQVASHLGISIRTVTVHVSNLLRKTRSRSRTDAAVWAWRNSAHSSVTTTSS